jgi:L-threonylcarbamoyladenylate synthase
MDKRELKDFQYKTVILDGKIEQDIEEAVKFIKSGENVALPTETVYGLAADATNEAAINKIFIAKNRPNNHPLILHISDIESLSKFAHNITADILKIAEFYWPGPVTMLLNKKDNILNAITAGSDKVAIRVPAHDIFRKIIERSNSALVAPSANLYTKLSPTSALHVKDSLDGRIAAIVDGGRCAVGIESTIIDMTTNIPTILRKGPIIADDIAKIIGKEVRILDDHNISVSGNKKKHYQPTTPTYLMLANEILNLTNEEIENSIILYHGDINQFKNIKADKTNISADHKQFSYAIYDILHQLDAKKYNKIIIQKPSSNDHHWQAIMDRLERAVYQ